MKKYSEILACPCDRKCEIIPDQDYLTCTDKACGYKFASVLVSFDHNVPVLINPTSSDTIFNVNDLHYSINRKNNFSKKLKDIFSPCKKTTLNIKKFIENIHTHKSDKSDQPRRKVLVIGGGEQGNGTYSIYHDSDIDLLSIDVYGSELVDLVADAHYLPFKDDSFDGVIIQAVLEHVVDPQKVVAEIYRVLKPAGLVYSETPFLQPVHEGAYDFTRFTVLGHRYLFKRFSLIDCGPLNGIEVSLSWIMKQACLSFFGKHRLISIISAGFFLIFKPLRYIERSKDNYDSCAASYFLGEKSNETISHKDLIQLYRR